MARSGAGRSSLDASETAKVVETHAPQWGWDERFTSIVLGKLKRGSLDIAPLDAAAADVVVAACAEGWGLSQALKKAGVTERRYFAWIAKAHSAEPDRGPYVEFRARLRAAFADLHARTGIGDLRELERFVP